MEQLRLKSSLKCATKVSFPERKVKFEFVDFFPDHIAFPPIILFYECIGCTDACSKNFATNIGHYQLCICMEYLRPPNFDNS